MNFAINESYNVVQGDNGAGPKAPQQTHNPKAHEEEPMAKKPTKKQLVTLAKEINKVVQPDPALDVKSDSLADDIQEILDAHAESGGMFYTADEQQFSSPSWKLLKSMGMEPTASEEPTEDPEDEGGDEQGEDPEDDGTVDVEGEEGLAEMVATTKKLDDLKAICETHAELKKLRPRLSKYKGLDGTKKLKKAMQKIVGVPGVEESEPEDEAPKKAKGKKAPAKGKKASAKKAPAKAKGGPTKKSIVIQMISRKTGASLEEIAERIKKEGIDDDLERNANTAKLWMPKLGDGKVGVLDKEKGRYFIQDKD